MFGIDDALLAAGASGLMQGLLGPKGGGTTGYDLPTMTPSPWDYDNQRLSSIFAQNYLQQAQAGQLPPGMEVLLDRIKRQQLADSRMQMFGREGQPGGSLMDSAMSVGAMTGTGPKATQSASRRAMDDYATRNAQIQNYIDSLKFSGVQDANSRAVSQIQQIPRSNELPWTGNAMPVNQPNAPGLNLGLDKVNWSSMFQPQSQVPSQFHMPVASQYTPTYSPSMTGSYIY